MSKYPIRRWNRNKKLLGHIVVNVFCKTGQGGGIDPTCSGGSGGGSGSGGLHKRIVELESNQEYWTSNKEYGVIWRPAGQVLKSVGTREDELEFEFESRAHAKKFKDGIISHNHPSGASFSHADLKIAAFLDLKEIRAFGTTPDGKRYLYSLKRPENGWDGLEAAGSSGPNSIRGPWDKSKMSEQSTELHNRWLNLALQHGANYSRIEVPLPITAPTPNTP